MARLGLGSVQWGQAYGVTHGGPPPPCQEVARMLARAARAGVRVVDTAPSYGDAERKLGALRPRGTRFDWVTKTATPAGEEEALVEGVAQSRTHLGPLYGLLDHFPDDLGGRDGPRRMRSLADLRSRGWVQKIGVSIYSSGQIEALRSDSFPEVVQLPLNVLDQRLLHDGTLRRLDGAGAEVHARSLFLQGLLLVVPERIPDALSGLRDPVAAFRAIAGEHGLTPLEGALGFVMALDAVDVALCGVQSLGELNALLGASASARRVDPKWFAGIGHVDPALLDPRAWSEVNP